MDEGVAYMLLSSSVRARLQCRTEQSRTMLAVCLLSCLLSSLVHTQPDSPSRPQVDPEQEMTILETCEGVADGTRCTKRCIHWTCDPKYARCYQGHCKRAGHHPCNTGSPSHPCCCGSCDKLMDDPENTECFNNIQKLERRRNKKKSNRKTNT